MSRLKPGKIYEAKKWFLCRHNGDMDLHDEFVGIFIEQSGGDYSFVVGDEIKSISSYTPYRQDVGEGWEFKELEQGK